MNTGNGIENFNFNSSSSTSNTSSSINIGNNQHTSPSSIGVSSRNVPTTEVETMDLSSAVSSVENNSKSILSSVGEWFSDTAKSVFATGAVVSKSIVNGVANIGEGIVDGITWCGGKVVEGASFLGGKIAGWFSDDAEESVMEWRDQVKTDVKEFISTDLVGEANKKFYQETSVGQWLNENSYLKYDSEAIKKITSGTEFVGKVAAATAATVLTAGTAAPAVAPLLLGFTSGVGEKSEKLYQENINTTGAQELGVFVSGLGQAANWYALGKLGTGALGLINTISKNGLAATGATALQGIKSLVSGIKSNGLINTIKGIAANGSLTSMMAADNLADSAGIIGDNVSNWLVGDEKFNLTNALKATGELGAAWLLNMGFDAASNYLLKSLPNNVDLSPKVDTTAEIPGVTNEPPMGPKIELDGNSYPDIYSTSAPKVDNTMEIAGVPDDAIRGPKIMDGNSRPEISSNSAPKVDTAMEIAGAADDALRRLEIMDGEYIELSAQTKPEIIDTEYTIISPKVDNTMEIPGVTKESPVGPKTELDGNSYPDIYSTSEPKVDNTIEISATADDALRRIEIMDGEYIELSAQTKPEIIDTEYTIIPPKITPEMELTAVEREVNELLSSLDPTSPNYIVKEALIEKRASLKRELLNSIHAKGITMDEYVKYCGQIAEADPATKELIRQASTDVHNKAILAEPTVSATIKSLETDGVYLSGFDHRFKSVDSIGRKVTNLLKGSTNPAEVVMYANKVNDNLRYTLILDESNYTDQMYTRLHKLLDEGYEVIGMNNSWGNPAYQGLNVSMLAPEGVRVEVQFHTDASFTAKEQLSHSYYEIKRSALADAVDRDLAGKIQVLDQSITVNTIHDLVGIKWPDIAAKAKTYGTTP